MIARAGAAAPVQRRGRPDRRRLPAAAALPRRALRLPLVDHPGRHPVDDRRVRDPRRRPGAGPGPGGGRLLRPGRAAAPPSRTPRCARSCCAACHPALRRATPLTAAVTASSAQPRLAAQPAQRPVPGHPHGHRGHPERPGRVGDAEPDDVHARDHVTLARGEPGQQLADPRAVRARSPRARRPRRRAPRPRGRYDAARCGAGRWRRPVARCRTATRRTRRRRRRSRPTFSAAVSQVWAAMSSAATAPSVPDRVPSHTTNRPACAR